MFTCVHAHLLSLWHSLRVEGALDPTLSHRVEGRLSLTLSHRRGKHSHSLTQKGKTLSLSHTGGENTLTRTLSHSVDGTLIPTHQSTLFHSQRGGHIHFHSFSHTQTHKVEATCTHTHVFTLSLSQN